MKTHLRWQLPVLLLSLFMVCALTACFAGSQGADLEQEVATLIYADLSEDGGERELVDKFNRTHTDVQIEVHDYSDENGRQRLLTEMVAGQIPDIIDLGGKWPEMECRLPYRMLAQKGYLEDLWPYIEDDPDLGREGVLEAPLKAAEIDASI